MNDTSKFGGGREGGGGYDPEASIDDLIKRVGVTRKLEWPNAYYRCDECGERHEPGTSHIYRK
jgi:hypothetical protein